MGARHWLSSRIPDAEPEHAASSISEYPCCVFIIGPRAEGRQCASSVLKVIPRARAMRFLHVRSGAQPFSSATMTLSQNTQSTSSSQQARATALYYVPLILFCVKEPDISSILPVVLAPSRVLMHSTRACSLHKHIIITNKQNGSLDNPTQYQI
ncbi:hypothetical protein HYPSUDRAFT_67406 [Hypholoma sublateritium FD-334 SS-4]|uniref:Uncharacterized protein n=1 Tax=Hypholoma sublateritium (strain FD-334 SS-4) TaxID=945553 RepID=A0A0D2MEC0_HYPSF|nr:hypothetical protein HYPSUDRAFT_67406 [Hypholoma sublateritium FD-334 SS-4]